MHHAYLTVDVNSKYDEKYVKAGDWNSIFLKITKDDTILNEPDKKFYFKALGPSEDKEGKPIPWGKRKKRLCYANKGQQYPEDLCAAITCGSNWDRCQKNVKLMGFASLPGAKSEEENFIDESHSKYTRRYLEDWQEDEDHFLRPWGIAHYVAVWEKDAEKSKDMDYPYFLKWYDRGMGVSVSIQKV